MLGLIGRSSICTEGAVRGLARKSMLCCPSRSFFLQCDNALLQASIFKRSIIFLLNVVPVSVVFSSIPISLGSQGRGMGLHVVVVTVRICSDLVLADAASVFNVLLSLISLDETSHDLRKSIIDRFLGRRLYQLRCRKIGSSLSCS